MSDREIITPGEGQSAEDLARQLISLADDPHDVRWEHRQGAFSVPQKVAAAYVAAVVPDVESKPKAAPKKAAPARKSEAKPKTPEPPAGSGGD